MPISTKQITQDNLPAALADGSITQDEVERIWRETEFLSAQTPIEVRQMIVKLKDAGHEVSGVEEVLMQCILDLRAALYRDESKFAHLVAGVETVVDKLQAINKWELLVERLEARIDETNLLLGASRGRRSFWGWFRGMFSKAPVLEDGTDAEQPGVEEEYDRHIGSNWDPNNPRKK